MTIRSIQFRLAAAILAVGATTWAGSPAQAFTMENLNGNPDGSSRYADPDGQVKNGVMPFGQNGPMVQFGAGAAGSSYSPFRPLTGFAPSNPPPEPYNLNNRN